MFTWDFDYVLFNITGYFAKALAGLMTLPHANPYNSIFHAKIIEKGTFHAISKLKKLRAIFAFVPRSFSIAWGANIHHNYNEPT